MVQIWSENPMVLLASPLELIYSPHYSSEQNANALARFVIYWTVFSYAITSRPSIIFIGFVLLFCMRGTTAKVPDAFLDTQDATMTKYCESPSIDNPMSNPLLTDFGNGEKLPACPSASVRGEIRDALNSQPITGPVFENLGDDSGTRMARRQFYTVPSTTVPNERDAFVHALYGSNIDRANPHMIQNDL